MERYHFVTGNTEGTDLDVFSRDIVRQKKESQQINANENAGSYIINYQQKHQSQHSQDHLVLFVPESGEKEVKIMIHEWNRSTTVYSKNINYINSLIFFSSNMSVSSQLLPI